MNPSGWALTNLTGAFIRWVNLDTKRHQGHTSTHTQRPCEDTAAYQEQQSKEIARVGAVTTAWPVGNTWTDRVVPWRRTFWDTHEGHFSRIWTQNFSCRLDLCPHSLEPYLLMTIIIKAITKLSMYLKERWTHMKESFSHKLHSWNSIGFNLRISKLKLKAGTWLLRGGRPWGLIWVKPSAF